MFARFLRFLEPTEKQIEEDLDWWISQLLAQYDVTGEEAAILKKEFAERERGKYTFRTYKEHLKERIRSLRKDFDAPAYN